MKSYELLALSNLIDGFITFIAIQFLGMSEANPLMKINAGLILVLKIMISGLLFWAGHRLEKKKMNPKLERIKIKAFEFTTIICYIYMCIIAWDLVMIIRRLIL